MGTGKTRQIASQRRALIALVLTAMSLAACGGLHSTYVPDGRRGYVVSCGGFLNSWSTCLVKAGRACGSRGYETLKGNEEDRSMLVACKVPDKPVASLQSQ